jgi:hypothetical protein
MRIRFAWTIFALFALLGPGWASPFDDAARQLDGSWQGDGFVLRVDAQRAQASIDPARPFAWQRFLVKGIEEGDLPVRESICLLSRQAIPGRTFGWRAEHPFARTRWAVSCGRGS